MAVSKIQHMVHKADLSNNIVASDGIDITKKKVVRDGNVVQCYLVVTATKNLSSTSPVATGFPSPIPMDNNNVVIQCQHDVINYQMVVKKDGTFSFLYGANTLSNGDEASFCFMYLCK